MNFVKQQKEWLKANGYWKQVKKNTKLQKDTNIMENMPYREVGLVIAFEWGETKQGWSYWDKVHDKMEEELTCN